MTPGCALLVRVGAGHHREQVGLVGVGDVALGPVQHVDVAIAPGPGLHRGGVGARVRLGEGEGSDDLAGGDAGEVAGLLLVVAEHDQPLAADPHVGAEGGAEGRRGAPQLQRHQAFVLHGQAKAAVFLGNRQPEQAKLLHLLDHVVGNGVVGRHLGFQGTQPLGNEPPHALDQLVAGFRSSAMAFPQLLQIVAGPLIGPRSRDSNQDTQPPPRGRPPNDRHVGQAVSSRSG